MVKTLIRNVMKAPRTSVQREVVIDYPLEGEILSDPAYTLRVSTSCEAARVEVQLNDGEWSPCREAVGLWWHDWAGLLDGDITVRARAHKADGSVVQTPARRFKVRIQGRCTNAP